MRQLLERAFQLVVFLSVVLLDATVAYSRAGGGGGYSSGGGGGGSSSSSSSGSSSGGSGEFTTFDAILMIGFVVFYYFAMRQSRRLRAERARARKERSLTYVSALEVRDPAFDLAAFTQRIENAFLKIQEAWSNQELTTVRGFMSDGLHERFSVQLREQKELGYRNRMSDVRILETELMEVQPLAHFDTISVKIKAFAKDVRIDLETEKLIPGSTRMESFTEVWSFLRGHNIATNDDGLFEGRCPNCASPIDPKRIWGCESCGSELEGAPPDWVLTEITQLSEWAGKPPSDCEWLKEATLRDPGLTEAQLEDRASVLFWRLMDSHRTGNAAELTGMSRALFLDRQILRLAAEPEQYIGDVAVGSVALRGIIPGEQWDLALVEVRWAGAGFTRITDGRATETGTRSLYRHLLVMARASGATSDIGRCIASAHCSGCGAPDEGALDGKCGFCGDVLNEGDDWLIDRFMTLDSAEASLLLAELRRPWAAPNEEIESTLVEWVAQEEEARSPGGTALYAWCLSLLYADQSIDRRELEGLDRLAERLGIRPTQARKLRQAAQLGRLEVEAPRSKAEANDWFDEMSAMAALDGQLDPGEEKMLDRLAQLAS